MRFVIVLCVALALIFGRIFWPAEAPTSVTNTTTPVEVTQQQDPATQASLSHSNHSNDEITAQAEYKRVVLKALPPSLQDVGPPAALSVDENGKLLVDNNLRKLADYYLSALGEEPLKDVMIRIESAIYAQLPDSEAHKALQLVKGYIDFKQQVGNSMQDFQDIWTEGLSMDAITAIREKVNAERAQFLPLEAIEAFFGKEDAYNEFSNQRHQIMTDSTLDDNAKQQQLDSLLEQQPQWLKDQQHPAQQLANYQAYQAQVADKDNKTQLLDEYRQAQFGPEANQRLKELDRQRKRWKQRLNNYSVEKKQLLAFQNDADAYDEKLVALKKACFTQPEIRRVEALERLGKL